LGLAPVHGARTVFAFVSRGREPSTHEILQRLAAGGATLILPTASTADAAHDRFVLVREMTTVGGVAALLPGPATALTITDPGILEEVDLFLVPGLVFDREGYRIGHGGGYFDRVLARARPDALILGLAFEYQVIGRVPRDPWDIPVQRIVTEGQILRTDTLRERSA
jgi:5-formyltetrahydrofolate cyclo-ligase